MSHEERLKILELLEQGKITADEAKKLLDASGSATPLSPPDSPDAIASSGSSGKKEKRILKILVYEGDPDTPKVRVNIPLQLAKLAMKFVPKDKGKINVNGQEISLDELNIDEIIKIASEVDDGKLIEVLDGDEKVIISLE
ncbi:hypothetical protein KAU33_14975 [Candidatus Dependentiae bacterium]|nr:hypothetical protein [Candidatus Dependentiae bacterium]